METIEEKVCLGHYMSFHYMSYTLNLFSVYIQLQLFPDQRNAGMVSFLFGYSSLRFSFPLKAKLSDYTQHLGLSLHQ